MKKVLVTGENGYIGTSFKKWIQNNNKNVDINFISVKNDSWKYKDFGEYDVILHLAGIAHISRDPKFKENYYKVNRDLSQELAIKAKSDGVKQFIFMSSIIVYGNSRDENGAISKKTIPYPLDFYGESKLQAEKLITELKTKEFNVSIIRTPMVYGENSKGNYIKLSRLSRILPFMPYVNNKRSMIYIENLLMCIYKIIENNIEGIFFPQNGEYINTSYLTKEIAKSSGKSIILLSGFNTLIKSLCKLSNLVNKIFGDLYYEKSMSQYSFDYQYIDLKESILRTEKNREFKNKS